MLVNLILLMGSLTFADAADLKQLQGVWQPTEGTLAGQKMDAEALKKITLTIKSDTYLVDTGGAQDKGILKVNSMEKPATMEISGTEGPNRGKVYIAIYEVTADTLKVCYNLQGKEKPLEFSSTPQNKQLLMIYKKK